MMWNLFLLGEEIELDLCWKQDRIGVFLVKEFGEYQFQFFIRKKQEKKFSIKIFSDVRRGGSSAPAPSAATTATSAATSSGVASPRTTRRSGRSGPSVTAGCSRASWPAASPAWSAAGAARGPPRHG